jgi:hypothetical protein
VRRQAIDQNDRPTIDVPVVVLLRPAFALSDDLRVLPWAGASAHDLSILIRYAVHGEAFPGRISPRLPAPAYAALPPSTRAARMGYIGLLNSAHTSGNQGSRFTFRQYSVVCCSIAWECPRSRWFCKIPRLILRHSKSLAGIAGAATVRTILHMARKPVRPACATKQADDRGYCSYSKTLMGHPPCTPLNLADLPATRRLRRCNRSTARFEQSRGLRYKLSLSSSVWCGGLVCFLLTAKPRDRTCLARLGLVRPSRPRRALGLGLARCW